MIQICSTIINVHTVLNTIVSALTRHGDHGPFHYCLQQPMQSALLHHLFGAL